MASPSQSNSQIPTGRADPPPTRPRPTGRPGTGGVGRSGSVDERVRRRRRPHDRPRREVQAVQARIGGQDQQMTPVAGPGQCLGGPLQDGRRRRRTVDEHGVRLRLAGHEAIDRKASRRPSGDQTGVASQARPAGQLRTAGPSPGRTYRSLGWCDRRPPRSNGARRRSSVDGRGSRDVSGRADRHESLGHVDEGHASSGRWGEVAPPAKDSNLRPSA